MGAGKTSTGRILAARVGYRFVDLDEEVIRLKGGRSVAAIFQLEDEGAFRELEARVTAHLDGVERVVVATGGGWMARPELRDRWPDAVRIWLEILPSTAMARLGPSLESRPLLDPRDPLQSVHRLLEAREADYRKAELRVETEGRTPGEVADEILALLRERSGHGTIRGRGAY